MGRGRFSTQNEADPLADVFPDRIHPLDGGGPDSLGKDGAVDQDGRHETDTGFLGPCDRHVHDVLDVDGVDVSDDPVNDDGNGKTSDDEDIRIRCPFQHRKVHADTDPERDQETEKKGIVDE